MNDYVEADWNIPYCKYEKTADGFKLRLTTVVRQDLTYAWRSVAGVVGVLAACVVGLLFIGGFFGLLVCVAGIYACVRLLLMMVTDLEVTKDAIIIDGQRYRRSDFGAFHLSAKTAAGSTNIAFQYGATSHNFGGSWMSHQKAQEFANTLNAALRRLPAAGGVSQPSPEQLRTAARPQEF